MAWACIYSIYLVSEKQGFYYFVVVAAAASLVLLLRFPQPQAFLHPVTKQTSIHPFVQNRRLRATCYYYSSKFIPEPHFYKMHIYHWLQKNIFIYEHIFDRGESHFYILPFLIRLYSDSLSYSFSFSPFLLSLSQPFFFFCVEKRNPVRKKILSLFFSSILCPWME